VDLNKEVLGMSDTKTVAEWMAERQLSLAKVVESSGLDERVVDAICHLRYTPSPQQRQRIAAALGVEMSQIAWGHENQVRHVYGHGPQFGRSP
jgi:hypothetical protein